MTNTKAGYTSANIDVRASLLFLVRLTVRMDTGVQKTVSPGKSY